MGGSIGVSFAFPLSVNQVCPSRSVVQQHLENGKVTVRNVLGVRQTAAAVRDSVRLTDVQVRMIVAMVVWFCG